MSKKPYCASKLILRIISAISLTAISFEYILFNNKSLIFGSSYDNSLINASFCDFEAVL